MERLRPFLSISTVIGALFVIVFLQMEERRLGYELLNLRKEQKTLLEEKKFQEIAFAKASKLEILNQLARTRLSMKKVNATQVIHLNVDKETNSNTTPEE